MKKPTTIKDLEKQYGEVFDTNRKNMKLSTYLYKKGYHSLATMVKMIDNTRR